MVTHDSNLKKYAHRAVYVRDGKMFKEETIPEAVRVERMQQLALALGQRDVQSTTQVLSSEAAITAPAELASPTSTLSPSGIAKEWPKSVEGSATRTEYRQPQDYKTYAIPQQRKERLRAAQARTRLFNRVFDSSNSASAVTMSSPNVRPNSYGSKAVLQKNSSKASLSHVSANVGGQSSGMSSPPADVQIEMQQRV